MPRNGREPRTEATDKIQAEKPPWPERAFNQQPEHQKKNHVADQMFHAAVHEHRPQHSPGLDVGKAQCMSGRKSAAANAIKLRTLGMPIGIVRVGRIDHAIGVQRGEKLFIGFDQRDFQFRPCHLHRIHSLLVFAAIRMIAQPSRIGRKFNAPELRLLVKIQRVTQHPIITGLQKEIDKAVEQNQCQRYHRRIRQGHSPVQRHDQQNKSPRVNSQSIVSR